ncbi:hypothetical protein [Leptolyngbya sp. NIES-2104]|nr:hypothetical protein [Leptolyngbya sp. NIES-2104]GAP99223.1 hypothetical protein NIES2104_57840 [Leptolyngbya sp. NIES-2104]
MSVIQTVRKLIRNSLGQTDKQNRFDAAIEVAAGSNGTVNASDFGHRF